jgi:hypothetical protein
MVLLVEYLMTRVAGADGALNAVSWSVSDVISTLMHDADLGTDVMFLIHLIYLEWSYATEKISRNESDQKAVYDQMNLIITLVFVSIAFMGITYLVEFCHAFYMAIKPGEFQNLMRYVGAGGFLIIFIMVGTNPQRIMRMKLDSDDISGRNRRNFNLTLFYFLFNTVPHLSVQIVYLGSVEKADGDTAAYVSLVFTLYSVLNSLVYRLFLMCSGIEHHDGGGSGDRDTGGGGGADDEAAVLAKTVKEKMKEEIKGVVEERLTGSC